MRGFPRKYGQWVVRRRVAVLGASLVLALGLSYFAAGQRYHNPYDLWFLPNDPDLVTYRQLTRQFGEDDFIIIAFRDPAGIFTNRALSAMLELTDRIERSPLMERVTTIANYQYVRSGISAGGEDELIIGDLIDPGALPLSATALKELEKVALGEKAVVGTLIARPGGPHAPVTVAGIVVRVSITDDQPENAVLVVDRIQAITREFQERYGYRFYVGGVPVVEHAFTTFGRSEMITFTSALLATVTVLLLVVFRRLAGMIVPIGVVCLSVGATLGVMARAGIWLNPLTTIIPQIIITVGIAEAIHLTASFFELRRQGSGQGEAVVRAVEKNFFPCLVTSVTTAIGFVSLVTTNIGPMRQFGLAAGLGTAVAWVLTFTFLPSALALWPGRGTVPRSGQGAMSERPDSRFQRLADGIVGFVAPRPGKVILGVFAVFAAIMVFATQLRIETSYQNMFKPHTPLRQSIAFVEANLGGSEDLEIAIDSGRADGVKDPSFLGKLEAIQAFVATQPGMVSTFSILDVLKAMNKAMYDNDPSAYRIPQSADLSAQYLLLYTMSSARDDLKDRVDVDGRWTRLTGRNRALSSTETLAMGDRVRRFIRERFPELRAHVTGKTILYTGLQEDMAANTVGSFATAAVPIAAVQAVMFRSLKVGLLSMLPNMLPIVAMAGMMGLLGIPLDPGSAMVASVGIGIVVDATVHFFSRYFGRLAEGMVPPEAVRHTLAEVGRPVVYTTFILAVGFSVFSFSAFNFVAYFGQLATLVIVLALLTDFFMTPALLLWTSRHPAWPRDRRVPSARPPL